MLVPKMNFQELRGEIIKDYREALEQELELYEIIGSELDAATIERVLNNFRGGLN